MSSFDSIYKAAERAAAKRRKRVWHWCRRGNGFSDMPKWRVVAERVGLPVYQVVAFVHRLEEFANEAGNRGLMRGEVTHFDAPEFAFALGMTIGDAEKIFAGLIESRWVVDGLVADFYDRNKDEEDPTAAMRQRRRRARDSVREQLAALARQGLVDHETRNDLERRLPSLATMPDEELFRLEGDLQLCLSTGRGYNRESRRDIRRDSVTVTVEETKVYSGSAVDNSGDSDRGEADGLSTEQAAPGDEVSTDPELWLTTEGARIVVERMNVPTNRALTLIERWRRDLDESDEASNAAVMNDIIARASGCSNAAHFLVVVGDAVKRHAVTRTLGTSLPLAPVPLGPASANPKPVSAPAATQAAAPEQADEEERKRRYG